MSYSTHSSLAGFMKVSFLQVTRTHAILTASQLCSTRLLCGDNESCLSFLDSIIEVYGAKVSSAFSSRVDSNSDGEGGGVS